MTREEIISLVTALGDLMQVLRDADPADMAEVYSELGLTLTYHPEDKRLIAEARPETVMYVGKCPRSEPPGTYMLVITGELVLRPQRCPARRDRWIKRTTIGASGC